MLKKIHKILPNGNKKLFNLGKLYFTFCRYFLLILK